MRKEWNITLIIIFALAISSTMAQTFPVRVTPILTPPYTPFLSDYIDPGAERLTIQIMLNDLTVTEFRTKLRMTIEGVGITITSNPNYIPPPISLQGGVPQLIYGSDIADYFKMSNMVFQGLSPNEVQKNGGRLPEGIYRISFEVLDYNRNTVVSNKGSATAWMILNDPPFINLPVNNAKIKPLNPQNIVFQWTPRHRGSPNAAFTTDYYVRLVEIWPAGRNPFDAINTTRPIFEATTSATMLVYGPAETPLVLGREYALQVRARDTDGRDVFKNNGYSEVVRFIYGDECPMPSGLIADDINVSKARMRWQGSGQNSDYLLRYREKKEGARWFEEKTNQSYYNANGLRSGTTYEYTLAGECDIYQSEYTGIQSFTTLAENPNEFVCADPNSVPPPDGSPPLPVLLTNDFIYAGGFDVVVNKATGSNGRFSGEGLAVVPWFNSAKVRVTFENIGVNTSYQLTAGEIKSVWDPNSRSMFVNEKTIAEEGGPSNAFDSDIQTFEPDTAIVVAGIILSAYNDPDGNVVIQTNEGSTVLPKGTSYAISDGAGNGYIVDKEGNIKKTTATDALAAGAKANREYSTDPNLKVSFARAGNTQYGFDEPQTVLSQNYQQTENGDKVAWKALATGFTDNVVAASQGVGDIGKATFKLEPNSQALNPTIAGTGQGTLTLTGGGDGVVNELLAYYPNPDTSKIDLVAGKLNVVSYNLVNKNLVLITVNTTTTSLETDGLQTELNSIYNQGVVQWTVNSTQSINVNGIDESALDDGGSGLLSNYTEDMKKILRAYTTDHTLDANTYYLFLVKNATSKSKLGYMPRKKQAGFIFVDAHNNADIVKTIAHELGHGAFHLKHTFSEYPSLSQGVTENLMDYPAKTRLDKWQWDHIHNPEAVLGLFEGDDEGASICSWWYRNVTSNIWPSESDKVLEGKAPLFNHVSQNFEYYFATSQTDNKDIVGHTGWSIRKSSFIKKNNLTLVERVIKKFIEQPEPSFELANKGVFLSEYTIEGKKYQVAAYSENPNVDLEKIQVDGLCALVDNKTVKIILEDSYILISFFKNKELQMTLQVLASADMDAKLWLKYMGILIEGPTITEQIKAYWNGLLTNTADDEESEEIFLDNVQYVSQFDESVFGLCIGCWTNSCCRRATEYMLGNTNIANCTDNTIASTAPYMTVTEKIITASFTNTTATYTTSTYNSATLNSNLTNAQAASDYMKERLDVGKAVLIGVHYTNGTSTPPNNSNRATRHFMVVVGYGMEGQDIYFRFYDPGRSIAYQADATSPNNKLIFKSNTGFIQGSYFNKTYTLTEVSKTNQ
ncbi:MAG: fibronectin type III domain-containing protein [Cyclobacteriaceae bacterium]